MKLTLNPGKLTLPDLRRIWREPVELALAPQCFAKIDAAAEIVTRVIAEGRIVYGVNTGFGLLASHLIPPEELALLQRSLVLSHAAGVGRPMSEPLVRLLMVLKINSLALGYSGVRRSLIESLVRLLNREVYPCIPGEGLVRGVGRSGPVGPHEPAAAGRGRGVPSRPAHSAGPRGSKSPACEPIALAPKEGLALLNGTQASTALCLEGLFLAEDLYAAATVAGALSVEAALASRVPFYAPLHAVRGHAGQIAAAARLSAICWAIRARSAARTNRAKKSRTPIPCVASRR